MKIILMIAMSCISMNVFAIEDNGLSLERVSKYRESQILNSENESKGAIKNFSNQIAIECNKRVHANDEMPSWRIRQYDREYNKCVRTLYEASIKTVDEIPLIEEGKTLYNVNQDLELQLLTTVMHQNNVIVIDRSNYDVKGVENDQQALTIISKVDSLLSDIVDSAISNLQ